MINSEAMLFFLEILTLSRIAILLLKGYFWREKINWHEKNVKHRKIIWLINFIFAPTNFLVLFQEKDSLQVNHFQFSKMNKLSNSAICL